MSDNKLDLSKLTGAGAAASAGASKESSGEEKEFCSYHSSRLATNLITPAGGKISFTGNQFITDNEDHIAYLDGEIKKGLPGVTKGDNVTSSDLDPMSGLRKKFYAEFEKEQAEKAKAAALGKVPDMGSTKPAQEQKKVATSNQTAS
jgi:hypothetical protein